MHHSCITIPRFRYHIKQVVPISGIHRGQSIRAEHQHKVLVNLSARFCLLHDLRGRLVFKFRHIDFALIACLIQRKLPLK